jgi:hypothetical protein
LNLRKERVICVISFVGGGSEFLASPRRAKLQAKFPNLFEGR